MLENDWYVSEETTGDNPDIYIESESKGTICYITGNPLDRRRALAALIAKAPTLELLPSLLAACDKAVAAYEWIIADHPRLDPDGDLPPELTTFRSQIDGVRRSLTRQATIPDIFENVPPIEGA